MELFLFLAILLQKFEFKFARDYKPPGMFDVDFTFLIRKPARYEICAIERV
jgi:hypothetical protein